MRKKRRKKGEKGEEIKKKERERKTWVKDIFSEGCWEGRKEGGRDRG